MMLSSCIPSHIVYRLIPRPLEDIANHNSSTAKQKWEMRLAYQDPRDINKLQRLKSPDRVSRLLEVFQILLLNYLRR